jgi:membrane dipeptidase
MIFDAHLDLSMNAMEWNRDLTQSVHSIRDRETGLNDKPDRAKGTVWRIWYRTISRRFRYDR